MLDIGIKYNYKHTFKYPKQSVQRGIKNMIGNALLNFYISTKTN